MQTGGNKMGVGWEIHQFDAQYVHSNSLNHLYKEQALFVDQSFIKEENNVCYMLEYRNTEKDSGNVHI